MDQKSGLLSPLHLWRRFRLGQKVMIAVCAACIPLIALGMQVSSMADALLREQLQNNLGLAANIEAARMEQALAFTQTSMNVLVRDDQLVRAAESSAGTLNATETGLLIDDVATQTYARLSDAGLVGLVIYEQGGAAPSVRAGSVSQEALAARATYNPSVEWQPEAYLAEGLPHLVTIRQVGTAAPLTVVAEWSVPHLLASQNIDSQLGYEADSMLLQIAPDGQYLILSASSPSYIGRTRTIDVSAPVVLEPSVGETRLDRADRPDVVQAAARLDGGSGWIWLIEARQADVYSAMGVVRYAIITVFIGAGLVILAVVAAAFRGFARRLERMTRLAEAVADGDLSVRTGDHRLDELGRLSIAFDDMAQALSQDIARRERVEAQLAYQATHDSLTGLPNRQHLVAELQNVLTESDDTVSALFIDLDGFKEVNDRLGHAAGDELLTRVGERLRDVLRPGDFVARLGGDEFVIMLRGLGLVEADRTASRVVAALELPFIVADEEASISASIGVSSTDTDRSAERLLKEADIAMYQAKSLGKGRAIRVTDEALQSVDDHLSLVAALRAAVNNDQLDLVFWPIADLRSGALTGMEASVRWVDPERGVLAPADFLALAERSGFASLIDEWVIRRALEVLATWRENGLPVGDLQMSINLTAQSFVSQRTRSMLVSQLQRWDIDASSVRIEVPEAVLRADDQPLREAFKQYRSIGTPITIDRFGSDYSNLDRLPRFAIDSVKIDLGVTADLNNKVSSRALITSLITLAHTSGLRVSAAGVDDDRIRTELLELGCEQGQGSWFSDAVDEHSFSELLRSRDLLDFLS